MEGLNVPPNIQYCEKCREPILGKRGMKSWQWLVHFFLVIFSYGWWLILFIPYFLLKAKVCPICLNAGLKDGPMGRKL